MLVAVLGGCALLPPGVIPADGNALVTVETSGGECPQGPCGDHYVIHRDGRVEGSRGEQPRLSPDLVQGIARLAANTDWNAVLARPFTGECPTAFDGQKVVYTFETVGGPVVLDSCEVDLSGVEAILAIDDALFAPGG